jgi:predicted HNH restriction endonuclease
MRKKPNTPRSRIRSILRLLFLRSRERAAVIKRDQNTCTKCGAKGSKARGREVSIEVHHVNGIDWDGIIDIIYERILNQEMTCLCKACHKEEGNGKQ